ncbi:MAG: hypothetical protein KatS3mg024_0069 [Armatimonadota bacterium]|nr:MAG: hypothetical protein KatS3mg024_0069 [Armatimonadota bacterium]
MHTFACRGVLAATFLLLEAASATFAATYTWSGGGTSPAWNASISVFGTTRYTNWNNATTLPGPADTVVFATTLTSGQPNLNGSRTVGALRMEYASGVTIGGGSLAIQAGNIASLGGSQISPNTIAAPLILNSPTTVNVWFPSHLIISQGISGAHPLIKAGNGTLALTAASWYAGPVTVAGGEVLVANGTGSATGSGSVTVKSGARLRGTGSIGGSVSIESDGLLAPGSEAGAGTLTFAGGLSLADGSIVDLRLGVPSADRVRVSGGTLSTTGTVLIRIKDNGNLGYGQTHTLFEFQGASLQGVTPQNFRVEGPLNGVVELTASTVQLRITGYPVVFVNAAATGANNGTSWQDAYTDLQVALSSSASRDIWVAEGTYRISQGIAEADRNASFVLKNGVRLYGGFPASGNPVFADRNPHTHRTILLGRLPNNNPSWHVVTAPNTNASAVLDGFVVTGGRAYGIPGNRQNVGGGIYISAGSPSIANCEFLDNHALVGGGMMCENNSSPTFINCTFAGNTATVGGASGGAGYTSGGNPRFLNCTFADNSAVTGGALFFGGPGQVRNSIFWGNSADSAPQIFGGTVQYSCVEGGYGGTGNINKNPQFLDQAGGDFRLNPVSPCAEAGNTADIAPDLTDMDGDGDTTEAAPLDLAGEPRVLGVAVDMGAYEVADPSPAPPAPLNLSATTVSSERIDLAWGSPGSPVVAGFNVYRNTVPGFTPGLANRVASSLQGTSYSDTGLKDGAVYYYLVTSVNAGGGESEPSNQAAATTTPIPEIIYVQQSAPAGGNGSSWASAFRDLQLALERAGLQDQIWVAAGTYKPADPAQYDPQAQVTTFQMKTGVAIYGGFPGQPGQEGNFALRDPQVHITVLSGNILDPSNPSDNTRHVVDGGGTDRSALLDGFVISGGAAGGLVLSQDNVGGGIRILSGSPTIRNCVVQNNWALAGGGIFVSGNSSPLIQNCVVRNNYTNGGANVGGGMYNAGASPIVVNTVFAQNTTNRGGGVYNESAGDPHYINCTFWGNNANVFGAAVWHEFTGNGTFRNCIFWGNTGGGGLQIDISPSSSITVTNSCVQGGYPGESNIADDPLFVNAAGLDFRLQPGSPCIDWGNGSFLPPGVNTDLAGNPRVQGAGVDLGALEYQVGASTILQARLQPDGGPVDLSGAVVSRVFGDVFYIQADDRSCGIRVLRAGHSLSAGNRASVSGVVRTDGDGERYIDAAVALPAGMGAAVPLGMTLKTVGGGAFQYNPETGAGQQGIHGVQGVNNTGLLIRVAGWVTHSAGGWFYLDDGSGVEDGSGHAGVRILLESGTAPATGEFVRASGISSVIRIGGMVQRLLRVSSPADIQSLQPAP